MYPLSCCLIIDLIRVFISSFVRLFSEYEPKLGESSYWCIWGSSEVCVSFSTCTFFAFLFKQQFDFPQMFFLTGLTIKLCIFIDLFNYFLFSSLHIYHLHEVPHVPYTFYETWLQTHTFHNSIRLSHGPVCNVFLPSYC